MPIANCVLPEDLLYHVGSNIWLRDLADGTYQLGMTDIAQSMAGSVIHCRIKKPGKTVKAGKSLATVESGKWVGPVKAPFLAEVLEKNEAVEAEATLLNKSPYNQGWLVRLKPADPEAARASLSAHADAVPAFETYAAEHDLSECTHCEGSDLD